MEYTTVSYQLKNNHYLIKLKDRIFLIDTGSPTSFAFIDEIDIVEINGREFPLRKNPFDEEIIGNTIKLVGTGIDGFIGYDILSETGLTIRKDGTLSFHAEESGGTAIPMDIYMILPAFRAETNGKEVTYYIDTGARYGYISPDLSSVMQSKGTVIDYNPLIGEMESDCYDVAVKVPGNDGLGEMEVCYNAEVNIFPMPFVLGNVTGLFEEFFSIDYKNKMILCK